MITIKMFQVSQDRSRILVDLETTEGETITGVKFWTQDTFKDYTQAIDLSSKLNMVTNTETFEITALEVGASQLNEIYFAEFYGTATGTMCDGCSSGDTLGVTINFLQFYYCINNMLCNIVEDCAECDYNLQNILSADLYLQSMKSALIIGRFDDAIRHYNSLRKICHTSCDVCSEAILGGTLGFGVLDGNFILG